MPIQQFISNGAIGALIDGLLAVFLGVIMFLYGAVLDFAVLAFILVYAALR